MTRAAHDRVPAPQDFAIHLASATPPEFNIYSWFCREHLAVDPVPGQGTLNQNRPATRRSLPGLGVVPDLERLGDPATVNE